MDHEVDYWTYCNKCVHMESAENEEPCCDCLEIPFATDSKRPVYFKPRRREERKERNKG